MLLAAACSNRVSITTTKIGQKAKARALTPIVAKASAEMRRKDFEASTSAPSGTWPIKLTRPLTVRTRPISPCVHFWVVRKTATKGPNPVWMSATKKTSQSRPWLLRREGFRAQSSWR